MLVTMHDEAQDPGVDPAGTVAGHGMGRFRPWFGLDAGDQRLRPVQGPKEPLPCGLGHG
ncbi:MAG: hypothetical protein JWL99_1996 [Streptomyces oryziradicis]|nr:hypothetical protein [Actinacidiphila oryziradicis]